MSPDLESIPLGGQLAAARRELALRQRAYPRWVEIGRLTEAKAQLEIASMASIVATLEGLQPRTQQLELVP